MGWGKEKKTTKDGIFKSSQLVGFLLQRAMNETLDLVFWFYFGFCLFGVLCVLDGFLGCFAFGVFFFLMEPICRLQKKKSGGIQIIEEQWKFCCT